MVYGLGFMEQSLSLGYEIWDLVFGFMILDQGFRV
jgi:hypothetical protein